MNWIDSDESNNGKMSLCSKDIFPMLLKKQTFNVGLDLEMRNIYAF